MAKVLDPFWQGIVDVLNQGIRDRLTSLAAVLDWEDQMRILEHVVKYREVRDMILKEGEA